MKIKITNIKWMEKREDLPTSYLLEFSHDFEFDKEGKDVLKEIGNCEVKSLKWKKVD